MRRSIAVVAAALSLSANAHADLAEANMDMVLVVPFIAAPELADEAELWASEAVSLYLELGTRAELAGVAAPQILTLSGCALADDACLATVPSALGTGRVVFATLTGAGDERTIAVIFLERDKPPERAEFVVSRADASARAARFHLELRARVTGEAVPAEGPSLEIAPVAGDPASGGARAPLGGPFEGGAVPVEGNLGDRRIGTAPWVIGGVGLAMASAGGVFWLLGESVQGDIDEAPTASAADLERLEELEGRADRRYTTGNVLVIAGVATTVVAAGLALYRTRARPSDTKSVAVTPLFGPHGVGFAVTIGH